MFYVRQDHNKIVMNNIEVLAPVGGFEQLTAAINASCDAVYIGDKDFSARHSATNFNNNEIIKAINLCHKNAVKVYIAINTLLTDREIFKALELAKFLYENNADALIIADEGLAYLVHKYIPNMKMHASTQMATFSYEGVKRLSEIGFSRVVLPREVTINDIKKIVNSIKINDLLDKFGNSMEIEVFCHGALCMSVSGRCYFSSIIGRRSGNRGRCAQPCRMPFYIDDEKKQKSDENIKINENINKYSLSLKDLCIGNFAKELPIIGVTSLKIEGRMKSPEYVYETIKTYTNYYKNINDNMQRLSDLFSRNGFTNGYFENKIDREMFGIRTDENIKKTKDLNKNIDYNVKLNKKEKIIYKTREKINLPNLEINVKNLKKYPAFILNFLTFQQIGEYDKRFDVYLGFENAILNLDELKSKNIIGVVLPKLIREEKIEDFKKELLLLKQKGVFKVFGSDFASLIIAKELGFEISADFSLNIFNSYSIMQLEKYEFSKIILSIELSFAQIRDLKKIPSCGIIGYGKTNLMTFRNCIIKNDSSCIKNIGYKIFTDRTNEKFDVFCGYDCSNYLYNGIPTYIADLEYNNIGLDFVRLDFTTESCDEVNAIIKKYKNSKKADFNFTRGLYNKGVL